MAAARAPVPVRVLGRYALYGEIAAGGMATVHIGRLLGPVGFARTVAIKRLHPNYAKDPEFVSMFLDEARLAARIRHPNVVSTIDVVAAEGELFLVMEYVQGESLARLERRVRQMGKTIPSELAAPLMAGVLLGLHAAHAAKNERGEPLGIVHRDVSPHNILVGADGVPRVVDFGVAKAVGRVQTTQEGQLKGKLPYMSPEQILGAPPTDKLSDVYSCAAVLWEMLTSRRLFGGENQAQIMRSVLDAVVEPPSAVVPGIPQAVDDIVMRGLARDPTKRFASARDMARALERSVSFMPASELGDWVEGLAGAELSSRATLIAEIETGSFDDTVPMPPPPPSDTGARAESLSTQLSSGSVSMPRPESIAPPKNNWIVALLGTVAGTMILAGAFVGYRSRSPAEGAPGASVTTLETPAPPSAPEVFIPPQPAVVASSQPAAPAMPPSTGTVASPPPAPAPRIGDERPRTDEKPARAAPGHPAAPKATAEKEASPNCNPPYVVDGTGMKRYKRECL